MHSSCQPPRFRGQASTHPRRLELAKVREDGEPTRRRAWRSELFRRGVAAGAPACSIMQIVCSSLPRRRSPRRQQSRDSPGRRQEIRPRQPRPMRMLRTSSMFRRWDGSTRVDRRRARIPGMAKWARGRQAYMAGPARSIGEGCPAHGPFAEAGTKLGSLTRPTICQQLSRNFIELSRGTMRRRSLRRASARRPACHCNGWRSGSLVEGTLAERAGVSAHPCPCLVCGAGGALWWGGRRSRIARAAPR